MWDVTETRGNALGTSPRAPKGPHIPAQGNALGSERETVQALKGRDNSCPSKMCRSNPALAMAEEGAFRGVDSGAGIEYDTTS